jgi:preprotein translocase subunit SecE
MFLRPNLWSLTVLLLFLTASPLKSLETWIQNAKKFYADVRIEMKKVTWPSRQEVVGTTVIVIIAVFILGIYLAVVDELSFRALAWIMRYFGAAPPVR